MAARPQHAEVNMAKKKSQGKPPAAAAHGRGDQLDLDDDDERALALMEARREAAAASSDPAEQRRVLERLLRAEGYAPDGTRLPRR